MNIVDIIEDDDVTLCVGVKFPEGSSALLNVHRSSLEDVHQGQSFGRAEAGAAVVHDAVGSDVLCSDLVHTATEREISTKINTAKTIISSLGKSLSEKIFQI